MSSQYEIWLDFEANAFTLGTEIEDCWLKVEMGVTRFTQEFETSVAPTKMFKALIVDSHSLIPNLLPQSIKSFEVLEGDGTAGSITQANFPEGGQLKYLKYKINVMDADNLHCKYTLIEGDVLNEKLEYIVYEVKFDGSKDGGCICKMISEYHSKGDFQLNDDEIKEGKEKAMEMYRAVAEYLLENPDVYA